MRFSTSLLSSAALLAMGTVGFAADLPSKKAAPVEYVRVCSQFGAGFFYIPGSDTCLKVGGRIRAEYYYTEPNGTAGRATNTTSTRARGYLVLDTMTPTDYGPLRATTRLLVTKDSGSGASVGMDWAYIQFMGFTAGRMATTWFDFAPMGGVSFVGGGIWGRGSDQYNANTLAYTATFGSGFSATIALDDATDRRTTIGGGGVYGGHSMPDIVGRLELNQTWGQAALTGAIHQVRTVSPVVSTEYGFAIQGGLKINLPMLAAGDALYLQAAYANGASSYTGWTNTSTGVNYGTVGLNATDATVVNNSLKLTSTYSFVAGLQHYWTPTVRQGLFGTYGGYDPAGSANTIKAWSVGTNVIWSPVKNLDIGAEVVYLALTDTPASIASSAVGPGNHKSSWVGRIRVQRDF